MATNGSVKRQAEDGILLTDSSDEDLSPAESLGIESEISGFNSGSESESEREVNSDDDYVLQKKRQKSEQWTWGLTWPRPSEVVFSGSAGMASAVAALGSNVIAVNVVYRFLEEDFWEQIMRDECNRYARSQFDNSVGLQSEWFDTTTDEMKAFIALCMLQSQVKKHELRAYWTTKKVIETPFFSSVMPYKRFVLLYRYLHFDSTSDPSDQLGMVKHPMDYINKKFQALYTPEQEIVIDESVMRCRGRLGFVRINERAKCGIKYNKLCESKSGYCYQFRIYIEKKGDTLPAREAIVMDLMAPLLNHGYTLYVSSWYSSPVLFDTLAEAKTNVVGIVQQNKKHMPEDLKKINLKKGEAEARYSQRIMAIKWSDKRSVSILTTKHTKIEMTDIGREGKSEVKPKALIDYNRGRAGIQRMNLQLALYPLMRRCSKAYKTIFFYVLDIALYNSYVLYRKLTNATLKYVEFRLIVAEQMLERVQLPNYGGRRRPSSDTPLRLQASHMAHFPRQIPPNPVKVKPSRQCKVCSARKVKSSSRWECETCQVALHMPECFKIYHTQNSF
jgi:hypothetical protein